MSILRDYKSQRKEKEWKNWKKRKNKSKQEILPKQGKQKISYCSNINRNRVDIELSTYFQKKKQRRSLKHEGRNAVDDNERKMLLIFINMASYLFPYILEMMEEPRFVIGGHFDSYFPPKVFIKFYFTALFLCIYFYSFSFFYLRSILEFIAYL